MGKEVTVKTHTLNDSIVLDGIEAVNRVKGENKLNGHINGGMAVQSYLPSDAHRGTIDLDFRLLWSGGALDFKRIMGSFCEFLQTKGYKTDFSRKGLTFEYSVQKGDDSLIVQHQRASPHHFEKNKVSLEREVANERVKSNGNVQYSVLSPEDLIVRKLGRILVFDDNYGAVLPVQIRDMASTDVKKSADELRKSIIDRQAEVSPKEVARLRALFDCYDIKSLAKYAGINESYFNEVATDWAGRSMRHDVRDFRSKLDSLGVSLE